MNQQLVHYITFARDKKLSDTDIRANLIGAGWVPEQVDAALGANDNILLMPPPPPSKAGAFVQQLSSNQNTPIAVVQQRTTKGLEYTIMFIALGISAVSLGELCHAMVDSLTGQSGSSDFVSYASSAVIVALPIFIYLFFRLKKAERANPQIRLDPSRRHAVQLTLIVSFLWGIYRLTTYIYSLLNGGSGSSYSGTDNPSALANILHTLTTLAIAGSIFAYYWIDEHRKDQQ